MTRPVYVHGETVGRMKPGRQGGWTFEAADTENPRQRQVHGLWHMRRIGIREGVAAAMGVALEAVAVGPKP